MQVHVFHFNNISLVFVVLQDLQYQSCVEQMIERFINHELEDVVMMDREFITMNISKKHVAVINES